MSECLPPIAQILGLFAYFLIFLSETSMHDNIGYAEVAV